MTKFLKFLAALVFAIPLFAQAQGSYSQAELDQMLAPVALYPDPLLSQLLMAATYPVDVVAAARWARANPGLQGEDAVRAAQNEAWDASVKSLVAFPQLLARMDEDLDWMRRLGEAFVSQEPQVMDTVQQLRQRAQAAGNLQSGEQMTVQQQGPAIVIQPAAPQTVYVPYYDPYVVYGPWWWPAYRPVYWAPWPRTYGGVHVSPGFFFGRFDWRRRQVHVVNSNYRRPPAIVNRPVVISPQRPQQAPPPARVQVNTPPPFRVQPVVQEQRAVQFQPQFRQEHRASAARLQAAPQLQPQARMPAAVAPPQPRAQRPDQQRGEQRNENRAGGRQRS